MSARVLRVLVCAALLGALACGGEDKAAKRAAAEPASEPESLASGAPPAAGALAEGGAGRAEVTTEPARAAAPSSESEERIGQVLDTDPEGAGLDTLIRSAREDADASVREAAVIALGDSEDPRALDALIAATEDADSRVVLAAIDQLGWYDDRVAEDAIRRLVDSPDAEIAQAAREELAE
jgi:HEAT repeat protein